MRHHGPGTKEGTMIQPQMLPATPARLLAMAALVLAALFLAPAARAGTIGCQSLAIPGDITQPGHYCVDADATAAFTFSAIQIHADDVVLDCNGHRLRNTDPAIPWPGIRAEDRHNVVVRNCVVDGWHEGISFGSNGTPTGNTNIRIIDNQVLNFRQTGLYLFGSTFRLEGNRITQGLGNDNGVIVGIALWSFDQNGAGRVIRDNVISGLRPPPGDPSNDVIAIQLANVRDTELSGNIISDLHARTGHCAWGIYGSGASGVSATNNTVLAARQPEAAPYDGTPCGSIALFGTVEQ